MLTLMSTINPGDYFLSMILLQFEKLENVQARAFESTYKLEDSNIVRNGQQYTKTTEDEKVFCINAYPPILLNTTIHLKNRG